MIKRQWGAGCHPHVQPLRPSPVLLGAGRPRMNLLYTQGNLGAPQLHSLLKTPPNTGVFSHQPPIWPAAILNVSFDSAKAYKV